MEKEIRNKILEEIEREGVYEEQAIRDLVLSKVFSLSQEQGMTVEARNGLAEELINGLCGYDILEYYLKDETISEIMVNGYQQIYYEKKGKLYQGKHQFESVEKLQHIIHKMVGGVNRSINEMTPIIDARLSDGSRINVVINPVALNGPILTIRKFMKDFLTIDDLIREGSIDEEALLFLQILIQHHYNIFISGGTSSGKTTFLNILSQFIPRDERIITIEDSAELQIKGISNIVKMEMRKASIEGKGEISIRELIKTALRMRPDRIIVGEVRGEEAFDMLTAMNTGHDGSLSTGHANSGEDMLLRLVTMVLMGKTFREEIARSLVQRGVDIIIHLARFQGKRCVMGIYEMNKEGSMYLKPIYVRQGMKDMRKVGDLENCEKMVW